MRARGRTPDPRKKKDEKPADEKPADEKTAVKPAVLDIDVIEKCIFTAVWLGVILWITLYQGHKWMFIIASALLIGPLCLLWFKSEKLTKGFLALLAMTVVLGALIFACIPHFEDLAGVIEFLIDRLPMFEAQYKLCKEALKVVENDNIVLTDKMNQSPTFEALVVAEAKKYLNRPFFLSWKLF